MKSLPLLFVIAAVAWAGPRFGGRVGYYSGNEPRTGDGASSPFFGGQFVLPLMNLVSLEFSGSYASSESDITMDNYLFNYLEEEQGVDFGGNIDSLKLYLEQEWGWSDPTILDSLQDYRVTFHDLDLGATLKINLPVGNIPVQPYIGGGGGAHLIVSDADVLLQMVSAQTGGAVTIDPYDKVHPEAHGVIGASYQPPMLPLSIFGEYRYARAFGEEAGSGGISSVYGGVNVGF